MRILAICLWLFAFASMAYLASITASVAMYEQNRQCLCATFLLLALAGVCLRICMVVFVSWNAKE